MFPGTRHKNDLTAIFLGFTDQFQGDFPELFNEIKTSGNTNKNEQNGKKIFTTKSFTSSTMNK